MYMETNAKQVLIQNKAYVFNIDVIEYWETVPGGYYGFSAIPNPKYTC